MILTATVLFSAASLAVAVNPQKLGSFPVKNAAFTNIYRTFDKRTNKTSYDLLISSFNGIPFTTDYTYIVRDVGRYMDNVGAIKPQALTDKVTWPNEISGVPQNVFNSSMVAIPDGFLVPFKTKGGIKLVNISGNAVGAPVRITEESGEDWFYHRVQWVDMDKDGDYDALTCRARKPMFGSEEGELLWYENPSTPSVRPGWTPHVIAKGPDVYFQYHRLNTTNGTRSCIFTAQFFTKSLSVFWTESGNWSNSNDTAIHRCAFEPNRLELDESDILSPYMKMNKVKSRIIDNTIGAVFDVTVNDVANDGNLDLLVTTNDATNGSVLAYEIPPDFRTGAFRRHLLASGFKPRSTGMGKGAPGSAFPIKYIVPPYKRPFIVSGDDDGRAYVLLCTSYDWTYNLNPFLDVGQGTVGQITVEDVNEDYKLDIFVPAYDQGLVHVYQYNPPKKAPVLLSGDDDGRAYLLSASNDDIHDWTYTVQPFLDVGSGTVGQMTVEDLKQDGSLYIFVPAYSEGQVHVFRYQP